MDESRKQHITLQLDAHHISLNVLADKEVLYRNAAEQINNRYRHYRRRDAGVSTYIRLS